MKYLLYSIKYSNGYMCFWRPGDAGYTEDIYSAGRYTKERVDQICKSCYGEVVGIPEDVIFRDLKATVKIDWGHGNNHTILEKYKDEAKKMKEDQMAARLMQFN